MENRTSPASAHAGALIRWLTGYNQRTMIYLPHMPKANKRWRNVREVMRLMGAILMTLLTACATPQPAATTAAELPSSTAIYPSPDKQLYAQLRHSIKPYTVEIIDHESGQVLGVAESSVNLSEDGDHMHGRVLVTYSDDLSTIVVHEEFSDASPNPRYILFQRHPAGSSFHVSYFAPPTTHTNAPNEFDLIYPRIQQATSDSLTLDYYTLGRERVIPISSLLRTNIARSSGEWPSEAYKLYGDEPGSL